MDGRLESRQHPIILGVDADTTSRIDGLEPSDVGVRMRQDPQFDRSGRRTTERELQNREGIEHATERELQNREGVEHTHEKSVHRERRVEWKLGRRFALSRRPAAAAAAADKHGDDQDGRRVAYDPREDALPARPQKPPKLDRVARDVYREGLRARAQFDAQKKLTDPKMIEEVVSKAEAKLAGAQTSRPVHKCATIAPAPQTRTHDGGISFILSPKGSRSLRAHALCLWPSSCAVPTMPGGSKYQRHPFNSTGFPPEVSDAFIEAPVRTPFVIPLVSL